MILITWGIFAAFGDRQGLQVPLEESEQVNPVVSHHSAGKIKETFVFITLQNDRQRVEHVKSERHKFRALNFSVWPAVNGNMLLKRKYNRFLQPYTFQKVRRGAIGCALSHLTLLEHLVASGADSMVVFEDDAVLDKNFVELYREFRSELPDDAELCQLLHHADFSKERRNAVKVSSAVINSYAPYGTVAYWVSANGAQKLLNSCTPVYFPIDEMYRDAIKKGRVVSYMPRKDLVHMPYILPSNIWSTKILPLRRECDPFRNKWTPALYDAMRDLTKFVWGIFNELNIKATLCGGALLGFVRHGGQPVPWDDDIDFCLRNAGDEAALISRVNADPVYCTASFWGGPKVFRCDSPQVAKFKWRYPLVDVFTAGSDEAVTAHGWPSVPATFLAIPIQVMRDTQGYLKSLYGEDYMTMCKSLHYSHSKEEPLKVHSMPCDEWRKKCE